MDPGTEDAAAPKNRGLLYVDLDGSLVRTDTLWESIFATLKRHPAAFVRLALALARGKAAFKRAAAESVPDPATLPFHEDVVSFLRRRKAQGWSLVLATAADARIADAVAAQLGFFDHVIASDGRVNRGGERKREAVLAHAAGRPFEFLGDGREPASLWRSASVAHVVGGPSVAAAVSRHAAMGETFAARAFSGRAVLRAMRADQWAKNALVFVPAILGHRLADASVLSGALKAFAAFCLCASAVYLCNDLFDLEADRTHPRKRGRPLASGEFGAGSAFILALASAAGGLAFAAMLPERFLPLLSAYLVLSLAYSMALKRYPAVDVLMLAQFYVYRVFAGSAATGVSVSPWLLGFAAFFFMSLALAKRYAELRLLDRHGVAHRQGRGYLSHHVGPVRDAGVACAAGAIMILAFYVRSEQVRLLYDHPAALWAGVAVLFAWCARLWSLAERGRIQDDPFAFTMRDRSSYAAAAAIALVIFVSS